jgi:hypothetical protein
MLLMDQLMWVPLPLKLHQQRARRIHFLLRVPLILMGLLGVREENSTFLQNACLLASTCSTKMLGSVRPIVGGWLKNFIGMRRIKRTWPLASTFHTLLSMRWEHLILLLPFQIRGRTLALGSPLMTKNKTMRVRRSTTRMTRISFPFWCLVPKGEWIWWLEAPTYLPLSILTLFM